MSQRIADLTTALNAITVDDLDGAEPSELAALEELLYLVGGEIEAESLDRMGEFPVNPSLPDDFDNTPNDERPPSHQRWWNRPYIVTDRHEPESFEAFCQRMAFFGVAPQYTRDEWDATQANMASGFAESFPSGIRYHVYCLDGGAWDRPTWWGDADTLEAAQECAKTGPNWSKK